MPSAALPLHYTIVPNAAQRADADWVLLLHGLFGSGANLGALAKVLAADYRVLQVDLRNHGRSPQSPTMNLQAMAADIVALQQHLNIAASHMIGHSLGGKVAMQVALNFPERVRKLVVADIAPVEYAPHHQAIIAGLQSIDLAALRQRGDADAPLARFVAEAPVRQFLLKSLYRDDTGFHWRFNLPALIENYAELLAAPRGKPFAGPTLFIKGELSDYIVAEYEPAMRELFPHFKFKIISGTSHWLHGEKPIAFNKLVQQFLLN